MRCLRVGLAALVATNTALASFVSSAAAQERVRDLSMSSELATAGARIDLRCDRSAAAQPVMRTCTLAFSPPPVPSPDHSDGSAHVFIHRRFMADGSVRESAAILIGRRVARLDRTVSVRLSIGGRTVLSRSLAPSMEGYDAFGFDGLDGLLSALAEHDEAELRLSDGRESRVLRFAIDQRQAACIGLVMPRDIAAFVGRFERTDNRLYCRFYGHLGAVRVHDNQEGIALLRTERRWLDAEIARGEAEVRR